MITEERLESRLLVTKTETKMNRECRGIEARDFHAQPKRKVDAHLGKCKFRAKFEGNLRKFDEDRIQQVVRINKIPNCKDKNEWIREIRKSN